PLCSSLLLTPRPPLPSPVPYTTLFRSKAQLLERADGRRALAPLAVGGEVVLPQQPPRRLVHGVDVQGPVVPQHVAAQQRVDPARDRKSTRLNSSHVKNSYAVFCSKKKT